MTSPAVNRNGALAGRPVTHPEPCVTTWYEMTCLARGRMIGANSIAFGTSMPQGEEASTTKNRAPLSFTTRKTSDSGSLAARSPGAAGSVADEPSSCGCRTDGAASNSDARPWSLRMHEPTMKSETAYRTADLDRPGGTDDE